MDTQLNSILEDIAAEIGFTATVTLVAWFGGVKLYVPRVAKPNHPLADLIGLPAFKRLVIMFDENRAVHSVQRVGNERLISIPEAPIVYSERVQRDLSIARILRRRGITAKDVAASTGLTVRRIEQIDTRMKALQPELVDMLLHQESSPRSYRLKVLPLANAGGQSPRRKAPGKRPLENPPGKDRGKSPQGKTPAKAALAPATAAPVAAMRKRGGR